MFDAMYSLCYDPLMLWLRINPDLVYSLKLIFTYELGVNRIQKNNLLRRMGAASTSASVSLRMMCLFFLEPPRLFTDDVLVFPGAPPSSVTVVMLSRSIAQAYFLY